MHNPGEQLSFDGHALKSEANVQPSVVVVRNIVALGGSQVVTMVCTGILVALLPRYLGDIDSGRWALASFMILLLGLLTDCGTSSFLAKEVARLDSHETVATYTLNALIFRLPLALTVCLLGIIFVNLAGYDHTTKSVFYAFLPAIPLSSITQLLSASLAGLQRMRPAAWVAVISRVTYALIVLLLMRMNYGVVQAALATNVSILIGLFCIAPYALNNLGTHARINLQLAKAIFLGGLPFLTWQIALVAYGQIDILLLSFLSTSAAVGWYSLAYQIVLIPAFVPTILTTALFPRLSRLAREDMALFIKTARKAFALLFVCVSPISIGTFVIAHDLISFLHYPSEFHHSVILIRILALHMPSVAVTTLLGVCLITSDRQKRWALVGIEAAILNVTINLLAIPISDRLFQNAAIGAAISTDITELFMLLSAFFLLPRGFWSREELSTALRCLLATAIMALVVFKTLQYTNLPMAVVTGAVAYVCLSLTLGIIKADDLRWLASYYRPKRRDLQNALPIGEF
jgi:O-antigen/teichoic acid export membrane protein